MKGKLVGPIDIKIGSNTYQDKIYVAHTEDDILLGLQFLNRIGASAHLASDTLTVSGENMNFGTTECPELKIARVHIANKITIPPMTVASTL